MFLFIIISIYVVLSGEGESPLPATTENDFSSKPSTKKRMRLNPGPKIDTFGTAKAHEDTSLEARASPSRPQRHPQQHQEIISENVHPLQHEETISEQTQAPLKQEPPKEFLSSTSANKSPHTHRTTPASMEVPPPPPAVDTTKKNLPNTSHAVSTNTNGGSREITQHRWTSVEDDKVGILS